MTKRKFSCFNFKKDTESNTAEIDIYGDIVADGYQWYESDITSFDFKKDLDALGDVSKIYVNINSNGGFVYEGQAIYNQLVRHPAQIHVRIDGMAASIASVIAMAGDIIEMPANAQMMIHEPAGGAFGNKSDLESAIRALDASKQSIIAAYKTHTTLEVSEIESMMAEEKWMSGQEAYELGFATLVTNPLQQVALAKSPVTNTFRNVPENLVREEQTKSKSEPAKQSLDIDALTMAVAAKLQDSNVLRSLEPSNKATNKTTNKTTKASPLFDAFKALSE
ncbi:TPA_asm: Clp protease ClpP [Listeria monocytogenes]|uniref:head maturation protease, ClpP-related n=1 Tax=Listeria seeligeri TaxID=1640 RepID=UPI0010DC357B|nr:head maturation protease, ClpP-related [Listeria seeligeri]EAD1944916.1 Clp protease ClpP [Listeria monocytogenes]EAF0822599.1 Clp protease ClpP [Listeria monocytogenes]EAG8073907.1 Clp protease ClpP [Listeria monocytogenes]EAG8082115.1 Clp protease ClpP [Listeria monocytogenes]EAG8088354.1 Clp protease ClpP [Listeria monocytogenes]